MDDEPSHEIRVVHQARGAGRIDSRRLRRVVRHTLVRHGCAAADVCVVLVDDRMIAALNRRHLKHSGPTDVITLDYRDHPTAPLCGEIYISLETARRQARQRRHSLTAEATLYVVHGVLHLLGYDDRRAADAARMHATENALLTRLGFGPVYGRSVA